MSDLVQYIIICQVILGKVILFTVLFCDMSKLEGMTSCDMKSNIDKKNVILRTLS